MKVSKPYLGIQLNELDKEALLILVVEVICTAIWVGSLYHITSKFQPHSPFYLLDWTNPFHLKEGWLCWAVVGFAGHCIAQVVFKVAKNFFFGNAPRVKTPAEEILLPLIGFSRFSTACVFVIAGVLAPILEEIEYRVFLMGILSNFFRFPTPVSVLVTAAVFAVFHESPANFPQLFICGIVLGLSYTHTRNVLTPITIHALINLTWTLLSLLRRKGAL